MERYAWTLTAVAVVLVFWFVCLGIAAYRHFHQVNSRPEDDQ